MKDVIDFLEKNGFGQDGNGNFTNGICALIINDSSYIIGCFSQDFGEDGFMFSNDLNIYWLIGVLTYYNLIEKDYKI